VSYVTRDKTVNLNEEEKRDLEAVTQEMFDTDEVPYGVTIQQLINHWRDTDTQQ